ncbi:succinylglutamate desuccinylase/aspartoacylase family protein [Yimella sp. NH-Cas1]|uniref:succinylglutamate desuccinylase/aspartoacylase family protein n=1 Tax=Yimella sp. NH-Cas1 TaxID=2917726 RepID=UPI001EFBDF13|nr:succinylglutamate desuccinylase/aspartoacylase family protein [Yimella sp. NH-Cas1]MCG8654118.1 succinylglutamate desuccinylase/aspartoacylase family protein [Yimella sp. NH-Cas1]
MKRESFAIGNVRVRPGSTKNTELPITRLVTGAEVSLPIRVVHGKEDGPVVWVNAAIHGDEVVGVEVIREVLASLSPKEFRGTLIAVPVVNVHGFLAGDRYLPDRRDLNRSFPGSARGSLAGRIAHLFLQEVVAKCEVGIDLHTASDRRTNLPQVRADLDDARTRELATAFAAPVMMHSEIRDGSLRHVAGERGARVLLVESGAPLRLDDWAIEPCVVGVRRVLAGMGMIDPFEDEPPTPSIECRGSGWVRARRTGILRLDSHLGQHVALGERLGALYDSFGKTLRAVYADRDGIIVGHTEAPLVNSGDALVHIATIV